MDLSGRFNRFDGIIVAFGCELGHAHSLALGYTTPHTRCTHRTSDAQLFNFFLPPGKPIPSHVRPIS